MEVNKSQNHVAAKTSWYGLPSSGRHYEGWRLHGISGSATIEECFTSKNFCKIGIVVLSFVFDKYCLIID